MRPEKPIPLSLPLFLFGLLASFWAFSKLKRASPDPAETQGEGSFQREADYAGPWRNAAELVMALATVGLLLVNIGLLRATSLAADAAKRSSDLAWRIAKKSQAIVCDPHVSLEGGPGPYMIFSLQCRTVADPSAQEFTNLQEGSLDVCLRRIVSLKQDMRIGDVEHIALDPGTVRGTRQVHFKIAGFSKEEFLAMRQTVIVRGQLKYENGFGEVIPDVFCLQGLMRRENDGSYRSPDWTKCDRVDMLLDKYREAERQRGN